MGAEENSRLVRGFHLAGLGGEAGFAVRRGMLFPYASVSLHHYSQTTPPGHQ